MSEFKIDNQIAVYKTNKKLCEFNDKLKVAPVEYYGHIHAQGEKVGQSRSRSCIGIVLQDYSKGTGSSCETREVQKGRCEAHGEADCRF